MHVAEYHNGSVSYTTTGQDNPFPLMASAVTVGSYDGVHVGHRRIIGRMLDIASQERLRSVVVTFEPHPRQVIASGRSSAIELLTLPSEKRLLMESLGIDVLFVVRFDALFASRSSEWFIQHILLDLIGARHIVIGYDHGFGRDRTGGRRTLEKLAGERGFSVDVVDEVRLHDEHFSSTRIRTLLHEGRLREANAFLGAPYMISGQVVHGQGLGRKIGFPTVNIKLADPDKLLPRHGVYIAETHLDGQKYKVMMNIGIRPTVSDGSGAVIEAHILGYSSSLYGREVHLWLFERLRDEKKFESLDALREQLQKDKKMVELFQK
ncbi:MAG: bifunctional riboflavin kinase/FAD synthetase [Prosthecochloris sp.]|uniref:Riboflavin biosynthesis protein n=1 Tax=Prosthecochloris aestuarii (strain DSM 271 / SK 413) TaxID=290512 RepID=B4S4S9_PROA2|nr:MULTISPECIES: bifunctional riboflavin kinase/FAD synthetase [Prosthecochloris]ACF45427.1 riboflavin biosynthesis protein RibF [Prosthecochloris aestuarii DSM 271]MCW8798414.1 bifunctional riboflavin kinase/FAD synthetase [Prosthecochloris sp.]